MRHSKQILTIQCLSTSNIRLYLFLAHCQAKALFMRACHANGFFSHTHAMTTHAMVAPYKSRVVSRGGLLLPLTYLPGTSVGKKNTRLGAHTPSNVREFKRFATVVQTLSEATGRVRINSHGKYPANSTLWTVCFVYISHTCQPDRS